MQFDGVDDYGTFPAAVNTDAFNSAAGFTVEAWVNAAAPTFWERFIDVGNGQANDNIILGLTQYVSGRPIIHLRNGSTYILDITSSMVLPPNTWTHLAYTYNKVSGECFIYMNGNVVASGTVSTPLSVVARTNAYIGKSNWAADALFSGKMDEIRVWSYARSQTDIQATMNFALTNAPSLVANYHCDENAPSMTTASINGNDMSLLNGTAFANTGMETLSPQYSFLWTGGSTNPTLATNASGAYTLSVTDNAYTCSQSNTENVTIQTLSNTNIAMVAFAHTTPQTGTTDYGVCDTLIATLQSTGASPASGSTTSKVWIDATQNPQFAKRHFEISPATGSTGRVTLYFTQTDFDDFNLQSPAPALLLPQNPTDATGIDNLKIEKFDGTSSDGSGAYFTYSGGITTLDPLNSDIVWNAAQSRWDVSFDVTSFSGFFAKTQNAPFPIELLSFSGENKGTYNLLQWQTVTEINNDYFEVERSIDAIAFTKIGKVAGAGNSNVLKNYELRDNSPIFGRNYYRLKQVDIDGKYAYSQVITISPKTDNFFSVYPNPAQQMVYIDVQNRQQRFKIVDALGKIVYEAPSVPPQIDLSLLSAGIYTFVVGEARSKVVKIAE